MLYDLSSKKQTVAGGTGEVAHCFNNPCEQLSIERGVRFALGELKTSTFDRSAFKLFKKLAVIIRI